MASSGSFNTSAYGERYLTFSWSIQSQSTASNKTTISWTLKGAGGSTLTWYYTQNVKVVINGTTVYSNASSIQLYNGTTVASGTATIAHNSDGTKTFSASAEAGIYNWTVNCSGSGSWALTAIPRYATVSQSLTGKTETTATIKWTSDSTIDYIWYSSNGGSSWTGIDVSDGTSGSYTISGLTADTAYSIKTRVRRKDSQLTTDSSALAVKTYAYPYCNSMPDFVVGDSLTIGLYNPLGRSIRVNILGDGDSLIGDDTTTKTSITGYNNATVQSRLYASIPNSASGTYKVKVTYGSNVDTRSGGTYSVNPSICSPSIGSVSYADINSTIIAITGNDQHIVRSLSTVRFSASALTALNDATIVSCSVTVNGGTYALAISGSTATGGDAAINSGTDVTATFTVTDSRGLTGTATITVSMLDWSLPTAIISIQRRNNYYSDTDLTVDADYSSVDGTNTITITYQARIQGSSSWTISGTLSDSVTSVVTVDNNYAWEFQITLTDRFGGTTTYIVTVQRGMPIAFFDRIRESVGINCFPANDRSLEVNGIDLLRALFYETGDTLTLTKIMAVGHITNAGKTIRFSIILPKSASGLTISCTSMLLNIRHSAGGYALSSAYVSGGYDVLSDSTITVSQPSTGAGNIVTFDLVKTTAFDGVNNTPLAVAVETLALSFT